MQIKTWECPAVAGALWQKARGAGGGGGTSWVKVWCDQKNIDVIPDPVVSWIMAAARGSALSTVLVQPVGVDCGNGARERETECVSVCVCVCAYVSEIRLCLCTL
jgi:hypothetical protein